MGLLMLVLGLLLLMLGLLVLVLLLLMLEHPLVPYCIQTDSLPVTIIFGGLKLLTNRMPMGRDFGNRVGLGQEKRLAGRVGSGRPAGQTRLMTS